MNEELWAIEEYANAWNSLYDECDKDTKEILDRKYAQLREKGNLAGETVSKHIEDGIFEVKANQARMLYYFEKGRRIIFVHGLIKKKGKIDRRHINLAKGRRTEARAINATKTDIAH